MADSAHDFYHLPGYVSLCAEQEGGRPTALLVTEGQRLMLLPLVVRPIPLGGEDAISPYGYPGPLFVGAGDPSFAERAMRKGEELLASLGMVSLFVRMHPLLNPIPPHGSGLLVRGGDTVSIDLELSADEHWRQTVSGHRNQINRAERSGTLAVIDSDWRFFNTFQKLYRATMERVGADAYYLFDTSYWEKLRLVLEDRLSLWIVKRGDGAVAAAGLFVEAPGIVQYHLGASDSRFISEAPTKLLIHSVRGWAKDRGHRWLHLGGGLGTEDDSLLKFKAGFSPIRHRYHTLRAVLAPIRYRELEQSHARSSSAPPKPGYFPAYRAPAAERRD